MEYSKESVAVLLQKRDRFLLQLRDNKPDIAEPGVWGFFGGGMNEGEEQTDCAVRELEEELGLRLEKKDLVYIMTYHQPPKRIGYLYKARFEKELSELELREGQDMRLFSREEIIKTKDVWLPIKEYFILYWDRIRL